MRKPSRRRSMTCSDLEEIASSAHGLERFPKCGPLRKEIYADIENLPIALSAYPTTGTTPLPRRTNHTKSRRGLYFRQVSASRISITKRYHCHRRAGCPPRGFDPRSRPDHGGAPLGHAPHAPPLALLCQRLSS